jgi:endonuclease/exonuclease/phosphatase family metal-dependent hydrolase
VQCNVFPSEEGCESRAVVSAKVKLGDRGPELLFAGVHVEHANVGVRLRQAQQLTRVLADRQPQLGILAGDFNDTPGSAALKAVGLRWQDATAKAPDPTWPADKPEKKIDYVLYRPAKSWRVVSSEVVAESMASDHRPVLVVLEWLGDERHEDATPRSR